MSLECRYIYLYLGQASATEWTALVARLTASGPGTLQSRIAGLTVDPPFRGDNTVILRYRGALCVDQPRVLGVTRNDGRTTAHWHRDDVRTDTAPRQYILGELLWSQSRQIRLQKYDLTVSQTDCTAQVAQIRLLGELRLLTSEFARTDPDAAAGRACQGVL